ncbi:hypothetical protein N0V83_010745 [Neocucurbitaria cava]|uniref:Uncharacterized protein n=1 Tax=Neocucurbitaria cava TaxID=798079 RepID=A0A9W8XWW3_9PLEO|nr:hypothetical protein N0V83_010745 [Neocucurbitaria cava]
MVLYHPDGRVVIEHEHYLENKAYKRAKDFMYTDQIEFGKIPDVKEEKKGQRVYIVIDDQEYRTMHGTYNDVGEVLPRFSSSETARFPDGGIDKVTFMKCSTLADEKLRYEPSAPDVRVPVTNPRLHHVGDYSKWSDFQRDWEERTLSIPDTKYQKSFNHQMAYIRRREIEEYIIPWLSKMEGIVRDLEEIEKDGHVKGKPNERSITRAQLPEIEVPTALLEKIHLYNAMLQFGLPKFSQQRLIDALILQMSRMRLSDCHLEVLENTVGRFHGRAMAILDPVINHFVGTYAFRTLDDRRHPAPDTTEEIVAEASAGDDSGPEPLYPNMKKEFLDYSTLNGERHDFPDDTVIVPPQLPVLGHCIKHWSGIRSNGSVAAAHNGYPLNVGRHRKYFLRRDSDVEHACEEDDTYRLKGRKWQGGLTEEVAKDDE